MSRLAPIFLLFACALLFTPRTAHAQSTDASVPPFADAGSLDGGGLDGGGLDGGGVHPDATTGGGGGGGNGGARHESTCSCNAAARSSSSADLSLMIAGVLGVALLRRKR